MLQFPGFFRVISGVVQAPPEVPEATRPRHQFPDAPGLGELMGKAGMSAVMQQAAQPDGFCQVVDGIQLAQAQIGLIAELAFPQIGVDHRAEHAGAHMHDTNTVQESGVGGAGKYQAQDVVLADVPQPLEQRMVNHLDLVPVKWNTTVNRVHDQLVIGSEKIINGTSHQMESPNFMKLALLYHRGVPE